MVEKKKDLRELLVSSGLLTKEQVKELVSEGQKTGESLLALIYKKKLLDEATVLSFLEDKLEIPHVDLNRYLIDQRTLDTVPPATVKKYEIIPLFSVEKNLSVATSDPFNVKAIDEVRNKSGFDVEIMAASPSDIRQAIAQYYGVAGTLEEVLEQVSAPELAAAGPATVLEDAPITKLVNLLLSQALQDRASDIHIEPEEKRVRVRYRIDGIMHEVSTPPRHLQSPIVSRIKVMSRMDISETRVPQDGRFEFTFEGRLVDVRVSSFPSIYGEAMVLRLLDKQNMLFTLEDLGFTGEYLKKFEEIIKRPYGIILVTGPTGSGKTTTLYATLSRINTPERNIITVEDPVEYELAGVRQSQINPKAGLVFATALRSILRQDPDIILVGEIRDLETAKVAIEAALTGHLVFSTLHTNDAAGALTRMQDMGVENFLISSACAAVIAQRLVRKICPNCRTETEVPADYQVVLDALAKKSVKKIFHGKGCKTCRNTGYRGRLGIFELLVISDPVRELILNRRPTGEIKKIAISEGMRVLREDGLLKVLEGQTTLEEVIRVTLLD